MIRKISFVSLCRVVLMLLAIPSLEAQALALFDLPPQALAVSLRAVGSQTSTNVLFDPPLVEGLDAPALKGELTTDQAFGQLLLGTGLKHRFMDDKTVMVISSTATAALGARADVSQVAIVQLAEADTTHLSTANDNSGNTLAATAPDLPGKQKVEEVIVTAQKRAQNIADVPMSIVALSSEVLSERRIAQFSDLALAVPSVSIPDRGGAAGRYVFMRGLGSINGSTPFVGIYVDEANVTGFPGATPDLRMQDLQRVEVLRGPQGTLYGVSSMGGTIRFITEDPQLDRFAVGGQLSTSFTEGGAPSEELQAILNVPLIGQQLGLRLAASYEDNGGWIDQPALGRSNTNTEKVWHVRAKGLWQPVEELEVKAMAMVHRNNAGAPSIGDDKDGNYTQAFSDPSVPSGRHDYELYNLTASYDFGVARLLSTTSYLNLIRTQRSAGSRLPLGPNPEDMWHTLFDEDKSIRDFTQEVRLSSSRPGALSWTIGGLYRDAQSDEAFDVFLGPAASPETLLHISTISLTRSWAAFGEASYKIGQRVELGAGLRYFEDSQEGEDLIAGTTQSGKFTAVSPRVFASYGITDDIKTYASVAKGFRSGGFAGGLGIAPYQPDYVWSYELGTKMSLLDRRLTADVAVFYGDYKDAQVDTIGFVDGTLIQYTANSGDARIKGLEIDLSLRATDALSLGLGGELIESEYVRINALAAAHEVGDAMDFIPNYHYTAWTKWDFDWSATSPGFVRLDYTQQGRARYGNSTIGPFYQSYSDIINLLNMVVGWKRDRWSIELFAQNLLNERGHLDAEDIEKVSARARPRTIGIQFRMNQ